MSGEQVFNALVATDVIEVAQSLNAVDKGQMALALGTGKFRALPKKVQAFLNALASELDK